MPRQNINTGTVANDRTGDTLRVAAQKINETFVELYQFLSNDSDALTSLVGLTLSGATLDGSVSYSSETLTAGGAVGLSKPLTVFNITADSDFTLADGSTTGQFKKFVNINTGTATVTPSNFAQGTSFSLSQNGACEAVWGGSNWHLFGGADSDTSLTLTP